MTRKSRAHETRSHIVGFQRAKGIVTRGAETLWRLGERSE
jgi:hypothetical protein